MEVRIKKGLALPSTGPEGPLRPSNGSGVEGFTIFEMIVAIGIFMVVVVIAVSSLLSLTASERKAITLQNTQDNLRFAVEAMAKEMRTGENFKPGCAVGCNEVNYKTAKGAWVSYRLFHDVANNFHLIQKASTDTGCSFTEATRVFDNPICYLPFTSIEVRVENLVFFVTGVGDDNLQPKVTIVLEATTPGIERTASRLRLQTTVAQRRLDT